MYRINTKGHTNTNTDITQTQQQRSESPTVTLTWHASKYKVYKLHHRYIFRGYTSGGVYVPFIEDIPVVEFIDLTFTRTRLELP